MVRPRWARVHLQRILLTLGAALLGTVVLGLLLARWVGAGLAQDPAPLAVLAVISTLPLLLALAAIPLLASRFLRVLYDIPSLAEAHIFLSRLVFGPWSFGPWLKVEEGKITRGKGSLLHRLGGPGYLVIYNDSAVVTERGGRLHRVLGTGIPRLEPFEKVWEVVDLRPQRWSHPVTGVTREGIPVTCEAEVSFKIDDRTLGEHGHWESKPPTEEEPFPYTPEAVFRAAISRWIREPDWHGPPMDWAGRVVVGLTDGILRDILAQYRLDWLLAPGGSESEHPRQTIRRRLEEELRERAQTVGARILDVQLGEIRVLDGISSQWIEAWQAEWESRALATRTEGEAELLRMDAARAQAQAEMVITLTQALQSVITSEAQLRPYLLATRFVEALRWMSYDPITRAFMPPEAMQTLRRLQDVLGIGPAEGPPSGEGA